MERINKYLTIKPKENRIPSRMNVGVFPEQYLKIKELVKKGRYPSINYFVIKAVNKELNDCEKCSHKFLKENPNEERCTCGGLRF